MFWPIKNSGEVLSKLKDIGYQATSLSTYDFSTLYTTLPHNLIKEKLLDLIERTFYKKEGKLYLSCNAKKAFFTSADHYRGYHLWSCQNVCDALSFLLDNIYFRFGTKLYRQIVGIPMGTNCAPLVADLFLLAHLSQRLIGELIGYSWSGVRPSVGVRRRRSQCSKIFFSETALPIKAKFTVKPREGGTIFYSRHLGHMTKMAATPIYGKNHSKIFFSRTGRPISTKLGM